jgi:hypothetical protein
MEDAPKTYINKTHELHVGNVVKDAESAPNSGVEIQRQTDEKYQNSTTYHHCEPACESPLSLGVESKGRRSKKNDTCETTNDEALSNKQCHDVVVGYSYAVKNTENVIPRLSQRLACDNLVRAMDGECEESCRNSRVNENGVYNNIKSDAPNSYGNERSCANCVQIFTLPLSILACIIGILALLVASGIVKLNGTFVRLNIFSFMYYFKNDTIAVHCSVWSIAETSRNV